MSAKHRKTLLTSRSVPKNVRASVTLRAELYGILEAIAQQKKVSTAWVLRDAAEKYVADQWPLLQRETT
jgi:predicted DNA-binding ribbon-helix-helix protein